MIVSWFEKNTADILPCISPDGFIAMRCGAPLLRSSLRGPNSEVDMLGFEPCDIDGDNTARWMRFKHPAGSFVIDEQAPMHMRHRTVDDDPNEAIFTAVKVCLKTGMVRS